MLERVYQGQLIRLIGELFPGCVILKNDSSYLPGIPDLTIFYRNRWAMLEVKASENAAEQPNQEFYVDQLNKMSFAAFIYPENQEDVLRDLQFALERRR